MYDIIEFNISKPIYMYNYNYELEVEKTPYIVYIWSNLDHYINYVNFSRYPRKDIEMFNKDYIFYKQYRGIVKYRQHFILFETTNMIEEIKQFDNFTEAKNYCEYIRNKIKEEGRILLT